MNFPCSHLHLIIWSHETGSAVPSQSVHSQHTTHCWLNLVLPHTGPSSSTRFPQRWCLSIYRPQTAIGPVSSLSGHAIAHRWRYLLPRVHQHKFSSSSLQGSSSKSCFYAGCCLISRNPIEQINYTHPSFPTSIMAADAELLHAGLPLKALQSAKQHDDVDTPSPERRAKNLGVMF